MTERRKSALVLGAGGFIGSHLTRRLKSEGFWVRGLDLRVPPYNEGCADEFWTADLREMQVCLDAFDRDYDEVYQLAADMGGAGYVFTGDNDAEIMRNSLQINLNVVESFVRSRSRRIFYSSSACVYSKYNQTDASSPDCSEDSAYPASPDSEYGWEKLFSERLYLAYQRNHGVVCRIGRFHNVFGPEGAWNNGREKSVAAICRKVATAPEYGEIELWGNGSQTRSFLFIDDCLEGMVRLMRSDFSEPLNIGSDQMISINQLAELVINISGKKLNIRYIEGPVGVNGRNSDNRLITKWLKWKPERILLEGLVVTYRWIEQQVFQVEQKLPAGQPGP